MIKIKDQKNTRPGKIVFVLTVITGVFWLLSNSIDVYKSAFGGAVFEILWLPIVALTFLLPVLSFVGWFRSKFDFRNYNFYALLGGILIILLLSLY